MTFNAVGEEGLISLKLGMLFNPVVKILKFYTTYWWNFDFWLSLLNNLIYGILVIFIIFLTNRHFASCDCSDLTFFNYWISQFLVGIPLNFSTWCQLCTSNIWNNEHCYIQQKSLELSSFQLLLRRKKTSWRVQCLGLLVSWHLKLNLSMVL